MAKRDKPTFDPAKASYAVGYGKTPPEHRWKKGQPSPNGRGRPTKPVTAAEIWEQELAAPVKVSGPGGKVKVISKYRAVVTQTIIAAAKGDKQARREVFARGEHAKVEERPMTNQENQEDWLEHASAEDLRQLHELTKDLSPRSTAARSTDNHYRPGYPNNDDEEDES